MADATLKYTISAVDHSGAILRRLLGEFSSFGAKAAGLVAAPFKALTSLRGLGLQSNIQLIRGLGMQLDSLIERGARLGVVRQSFESLSGHAGRAADRLARQFKAAAQGTISQARAMEIANRALAAGLSEGDIKTALEFVAKKAVTTGKDAGQAIETVLTGLSRGSTLFLDDFGILVNGIDGVKRDFDKIKGAGAFDQLGPAAQKAAIINAAMADINRQMVNMGVTGQETVFQWARIKTAMTDAADKLVSKLVGTAGFQGALKNLASIASGLADSLGGPDQGEALKSLGERAKTFLGSVFRDIGRLLIDGAVEAWNYFVPKIFEAAKQFGVFIKDVLLDAGERFAARMMLLLSKIPLFQGVFNTEALEKRLKAPGPLAPLIEPFKNYKTAKLFAETLGVIEGLGKEFEQKRYGKDEIEKAEEDAAKRLSPASRAAMKEQGRKIDRERERLELTLPLADKSEMASVWQPYAVAARKELAAGKLGGAGAKNMSPQEREEKLVQPRARELAEARYQELSRRRNQLSNWLGESTAGGGHLFAQLWAGLSGQAGRLAPIGAGLWGMLSGRQRYMPPNTRGMWDVDGGRLMDNVAALTRGRAAAVTIGSYLALPHPQLYKQAFAPWLAKMAFMLPRAGEVGKGVFSGMFQNMLGAIGYNPKDPTPMESLDKWLFQDGPASVPKWKLLPKLLGLDAPEANVTKQLSSAARNTSESARNLELAAEAMRRGSANAAREIMQVAATI